MGKSYIYIFIHMRRKFRSQTSDNMDSRGGNSQKRERVRIERVGKRVSAKADVCGFFTWQEPQWPWWTAEFMWVCLKSNRKPANFPCNCGVYLNSINAVYPNFQFFQVLEIAISGYTVKQADIAMESTGLTCGNDLLSWWSYFLSVYWRVTIILKKNQQIEKQKQFSQC